MIYLQFFLKAVLPFISWLLGFSKMNNQDKQAFYALIQSFNKKYGRESAIAADTLDEAEKNLNKPKE